MNRSNCWRLLGRLTLPVLALSSTQCGSSQPHANGVSGATGTSGSENGGGSDASSGGGNTSSAGATMTVPGAPGCGFGDKAAFCETFDAPAQQQGRAGELDSLKWSGARQSPQAPTGGGLAIAVIAGDIPSCRSGLPAKAFPDQDTLICDPNPAIKSNHLLTACASQNYGQNSYRIRQPFDFSGRAGKVVFDAEGFNQQLLGWVSVEISEDPTPGPSFALGTPGTANDEGSVVPRNAVEIQFEQPCGGQGSPPAVGVGNIITIANYQQTEHAPSDPVCMTTQQGSLNHFEVNVSQNRVEVYGTNASTDGSSFDAPTLMYASDVQLPFTRGYVSITTHNHATRKYSANNALTDWVARWDNVGFDGPVLSYREYEIPDSLVATTAPFSNNEPVTDIAYLVADAAGAPKDTLHFKGVNLDGMSKARLALSTWFLPSMTNAQYVLNYRLNGGTWRDRPLTTDEAALLSDTRIQGAMAMMIDLTITDLVSGDNTLEFTSQNIPQNYPPAVSNIDLVLSN